MAEYTQVIKLANCVNRDSISFRVTVELTGLGLSNRSYETGRLMQNN